MNYANDRLRELIGNQRIFEINEKVYRDVKTYLDDKDKSLARRVLNVLSRLSASNFWSKTWWKNYTAQCHKIHVKLAAQCWESWRNHWWNSRDICKAKELSYKTCSTSTKRPFFLREVTPNFPDYLFPQSIIKTLTIT